MTDLFDKTEIRGMELKNRLIRSATHEGMSDEDGSPGPSLFKLYKRLAKGGVGLIITGYANVSKDGKSPNYRMQAMDRDELIGKYRELVNHVHENGAKIAMQLVHCGRQTSDSVIGTQPIAPSAVLDTSSGVMPREMTEHDIERVIQDFTQGARRVREAGFDAVQIHCAHGYLLSSFICPHTNRRTDQWGGNTESRVRIVGDVYKRCRAQVGSDFPILVKYSGWDNMEHGLRPEEGVIVGQMLADIGFDSIEISAGIFEDGGSGFGNVPMGARSPQAFNRHVAKPLKRKIKAPVMLVGGITDPMVMKEIVDSGDADYISMCRALVSDPAFPRKIRDGRLEPARCLQCNLCAAYSQTRPLLCYYGKILEDEAPPII